MAEVVSVQKLANMAMTMYYKGFRPSNGPYRLEHFLFLCLAADAKLKQDEYSAERNLRIRMRQPHADISMAPDNYETVKVVVKNEAAKLPNRIMGFSGDKGNLGVNSVTPEGNCKAPFIRINRDEIWTTNGINDVVFWYSDEQCIKFINLDKICKPEKVVVNYMPQLSNKSIVQKSREYPILAMVGQFIQAFENGTLVDMSNDGNPNKTLMIELNKYLQRNVQRA